MTISMMIILILKINLYRIFENDEYEIIKMNLKNN